jgi:hypothetical protein
MKFVVILLLVLFLLATVATVIKLLLSAVAMGFLFFVLLAILRNALQ